MPFRGSFSPPTHVGFSLLYLMNDALAAAQVDLELIDDCSQTDVGPAEIRVVSNYMINNRLIC